MESMTPSERPPSESPVGSADAGADWSATVADLPRLWAALVNAPAPDIAGVRPDTARASLAQALQSLLQLSGANPAHNLDDGPAGQALGFGSRSFVDTVRALLALVQDPMSPLPGELAMALVLSQERLADLRLRQLLAAQDPQWPERVTRALMEEAWDTATGFAPEGAPLTAARAAAGATVEGRRPFSAEAVTEATPRAVRDWWAVPVEGLRGSNQLFLLETRELLRGAELSLMALGREPGDYAEQMVLCRSFQAVAVAAASMGLQRLADIAAEGEAQFDGLLEQGGFCSAAVLHDTEARLEALYRELMDLVGESVPPLPDDVGATAPVPVADHMVVQPSAVQAVVDPPPLSAPAMAQPPWWWAVDWSDWAGQPDRASDDVLGQAAVAAAEGAAAEAAVAESLVRVPTRDVQAWAHQLETQGEDPGVRQRVVRALEDAACVPLESWSVALFRTARRVAREQDQTMDFDIEGGSQRIDAAMLHRIMSVLEGAVASRVEQATGSPMRLVARAHQGGVRIQLGDSHAAPWADTVVGMLSSLSIWLRMQGGALRSMESGWILDVPTTATRVPVLNLRAGALDLQLPALWVAGERAWDPAVDAAALEQGVLHHANAEWPLVSLSALLRTDSDGGPQAVVLLVDDGHARLALVVDGLPTTSVVRPLPWPPTLASLRARSGLWAAAQAEDRRLALVIDPIALHERFGSAARVLARSRARRSHLDR